MLEILTILSKGTVPYWNMLKRRLAEQQIAPLTIVHAPNLVGHPVGIAVLFLLGSFVLPGDPLFYIYWFIMIVIAGIMSVFAILGLLETKFFTTQVIGSLGFVSSSVCAALFLGETMNAWTILALCLGVLGVILFSWSRGHERFFVFDRGMIFTILSVILVGFAAIFYKLAALHVSSYSAFFTGRFVADLVAWTIVWLVGLSFAKKHPIKDLRSLFEKRDGKIYAIGFAAVTFLDSYLIYNLPVTTIAMLGTIAFPVTYLISYFKYRERITLFMWLGTALIIGSIILFLFNR